MQTNLIAVAEWLNLNDRDEFMNVYANVRGQVRQKSGACKTFLKTFISYFSNYSFLVG